jgi:hypothetical protein
MNDSEFDGQAVDYVSASRHSCPLCSAPLVRMPRRGIDRLLSHFVLVQRFRCDRFVCQWQGNLRVAQAPGMTTLSAGPARTES